jgi:hypothetical protein
MCPWCESTEHPKPANAQTARFVFGAATPRNLQMNPAQCAECDHVGTWDHFHKKPPASSAAKLEMVR